MSRTIEISVPFEGQLNASVPGGQQWPALLKRLSQPSIAEAAIEERPRRFEFAKRACDVLGATALLLIFSPLMAFIYALLFITTRGKPIFAQVRVGRNGKRFVLYKFRTMVDNAERLQTEVKNELDGPVFKNRRDPRVTRIGRVLRKLSLDELPQLFNVLKGDMSLVGPRPPVPREVAQYTPYQMQRLSVKPGLTGLWQISGRADLPFERWVELDLEYVRKRSLLLDLYILLRTPWAVLSGKGAY